MAESGSRDHIALEGRTLREHTTQGVVINGAFQVGLAFLGAARYFLIAIFITASEYGVWGLIFAATTAILFFKDVGIGDKYIQQTDDDQETAFQKAFSLELAWCGLFAVLVACGVPIFALVYGRPEIIAPGLVLTLVVMASPFLTPSWVFYREMRFLKQRTLLSIEPVVSFVVMIGLAATGFGYWALVLGAIAGTWSAAIACIIAAPYKLRWRYEPGTLREYFSFSWPLLVATGSGVLTVQLAIIVGESTVGLAGVGAIGLAGTILAFADRADMLVTQTLYPAICAVRDQVDLLRESFAKSNRLALVWSLPFCLGTTLFAEDLVTYVLGSKWDNIVPLLQVFGVTCALKQIAFSWTAYHRAVGETRPMAVNAIATLVTFVIVGVPGMILWGLDGYALGIGVMSVVQLAIRSHYLSRLLGGFGLLRHSLRAFVPMVPAVAAVLALRLIETGERTPELALGEFAVYALVTVLATWMLERDLVQEVRGYLRPRPAGAA
jgi:PST family polysaccharide transporter